MLSQQQFIADLLVDSARPVIGGPSAVPLDVMTFWGSGPLQPEEEGAGAEPRGHPHPPSPSGRR